LENHGPKLIEGSGAIKSKNIHLPYYIQMDVLKKYKPVSRVLYPINRISIIDLDLFSQTGSSSLPITPIPKERKASNFPTGQTGMRDLHGLSARKVYPIACRHTIRELLPHVFTLIEMLPLRRYSFLWHFLFPENFFPETYPLGSAALCAARTFLCSISNSDGTVCTTKIPKQKAPAIPGLFLHLKAII